MTEVQDNRIGGIPEDVSSDQVAAIMSVVTLLAPQFTTLTWNYRGELLVQVGVVTFAFLWSIGPPNDPFYPGFRILDPRAVMSGIHITGLHFLFAIAVIRYCGSKGSWRTAVILGFLSIAWPLFWGILAMIHCFSKGIVAYSGPIPISLIVGLILMHYASYPSDGKPRLLGESQEGWLEEDSAK